MGSEECLWEEGLCDVDDAMDDGQDLLSLTKIWLFKIDCPQPSLRGVIFTLEEGRDPFLGESKVRLILVWLHNSGIKYYENLMIRDALGLVRIRVKDAT